jgi:AbrB family looped-hinge helix DNA binding protein
MQTSIDRFGRIILPKKVRDDLDLHPGIVLRIEEHNREIILVPIFDEPNIVDKDGVLVYSGRPTGDIENAVRTQREKRMKKLTRKTSP